uniref:Mariner Mos1 transposase n=1 Tax=Clastoptera arizonana TaxID=38151 RepID=A0A1B6DMM9_9HEMI
MKRGFVMLHLRVNDSQWSGIMLIHQRNQKNSRLLSTRKLMATIFWDRRGVLLIDFMALGDTINANAYCETLKKLRWAIQNRRRGLLSDGVILLHDNARPHAAG